MTVAVHHGDCLEVMARLADEGELFDAIVTDPPYHLTSIVKRFGGPDAAAAKAGTTGAYARAARGFMGKQWDGGDIAFRAETWALALRLLKPGGHLVAFSGTRTYHRMVCAIEDAGFEVRDQLAWVYGSGFPKSHNLDGDWQGWGTALKPAWEPICLARTPPVGTVAANVLAHGTGALNIDACRVGTETVRFERTPGNVSREQYRKGTTIGPKIPVDHGRWPANLVHDGSAEVLAGFPREAGAGGPVTGAEASTPAKNVYGEMGRVPGAFHGDAGSAARFFYSAKADAADRLGSKHPTVKPIDLKAWLLRLVTPPGGVVLDPFAGSGTTGMAALREGFGAVLIEREAEYVADIHRRLAHVRGGDTPLFGDGPEAAEASGGGRRGRRIYGVFADEPSARRD